MRYILILSLICFISGCGFRPLYIQNNDINFYTGDTQSSSIINELAQIKILSISDRFGQQLRNKLIDLLTPKGVPTKAKYRLEVKLTQKQVSQQAMRTDVTATNERVTYTVKYTLFEGSQKLVSGDSYAFVSYNILTNPFSTTMAQKKSEENAANIIAQDIALRLGAYFHSEKTNRNDL